MWICPSDYRKDLFIKNKTSGENMTQTFNENVLVDGSQDIEQLRVQGNIQQTESLQTWEASGGSVLAQVTGDGRLIIGEDVTPESLLEAHRLETSITRPRRGLHTLGRIGD